MSSRSQNKMLNDNNESKYTYLKDEPIDGSVSGLIKFGHTDIADALVSTVLTAQPPFTVGLFGGWGTGKSTIVIDMKAKLTHEKIPVVIFDTWKHSGDSLRRTFLYELVLQLKQEDELAGNFELEERVMNSTEKEKTESPYTYIRNRFNEIFSKKWVKTIIVLLLISFAVCLYYVYIKNGFISSLILFIQILILAISTILTYISSFFASFTQNSLPESLKSFLELFIPTETKTIIFDRFVDPHEFEGEFKRIISSINSQKVLIVFDNLDRVDKTQMIKVLTTIKTFLDPVNNLKNNDKKILFLIACDETAIRENICSYFKTNNANADADEYLRKFFSSSITIPQFIQCELESFTKEKLKETNISNLLDDKVSWVITKAFRDNPRQIIQFINTMITNYILIEKRLDKDFPLDFLNSNISQLAKYLIIKQMFPDSLRVILENNVVILNDDNIKEIPEIKKDAEFINFVKETEREIPINNLKQFSILRRSEIEKSLTGVEDFFLMLEDNRFEDAIKQLGQINVKDKANITKLSSLVKDRLSNITNLTTLAALVSNLLRVLDNINIRLSETTYNEILSKISNFDIFRQLNLSPEILYRQLSKSSTDAIEQLVSNWISLLNELTENKLSEVTQKTVIDIINILKQLQVSLTDEQKKQVREIVKSSSFISDKSIRESLIQDKESQKLYLSKEFVTGYLGIINPDEQEISEINNKVQFFNNINEEYIDSSHIDDLMKKLTGISILMHTKPVSVEQMKTEKQLVDSIFLFMSDHTLIDNDSLKAIVKSLIDNITRIPDHSNRYFYIALFIVLIEVVSDPQLTQLKNLTNEFFNNSSIEKTDLLIEEYNASEDVLSNPKYHSILETRALRDQPFFEYLYPKFEQEKAQQLLTRLIDTDVVRAIKFIGGVEKSIKSKGDIITKLLTKIDINNPAVSNEIFKVCNQLRCGNKQSNRITFADKVTLFIRNTDNQIQKIGFDAFKDSTCHIGKNRIRSIAKNIFDWLQDNSQVPTKVQPFAIQAIQIGYDQFNKEEKNSFLQFIFEELIRKPNDISSIDLGFSVLDDLKPNYNDRKENYEDIKSKYETTTDQTIKNAIIAGLKRLTFSQKSKGSREFFDWIQGQVTES
ncbi:P-loop NTPase fold protein [Patescibacteria group bacterium]